jgi:hypothetical protein
MVQKPLPQVNLRHRKEVMGARRDERIEPLSLSQKDVCVSSEVVIPRGEEVYQ